MVPRSGFWVPRFLVQVHPIRRLRDINVEPSEPKLGTRNLGTLYRPRFPPRILPNIPRRIDRPSPDPTERAALLAADSSIPSLCPPRGPVDPNSRSFNAVPVVPGAAGGAGVPGEGDVPGEADVPALAFSFSYADSRSTGVSYTPFTIDP